MKFNELLLLRQGIVNYTKDMDRKELFEGEIDSLVTRLERTGVDFQSDDLKSLLFSVADEEHFFNFFYDDHPVWTLNKKIREENAAYERFSSFTGRSVYGMALDDLSDSVLKYFMMPKDEYKKLADSISTDELEDWDPQFDFCALSGLINARGGSFGREEILEQLMSMNDFGYGFMNDQFKRSFNFKQKATEHCMSGVTGLFYAFQETMEEFDKFLQNHRETDSLLTSKHKVEPPRLIPSATLELDIIPLYIGFSSYDQLTVLGTYDDSPTMKLQTYSLESGTIIGNVDTKVRPRFDGILGMISQFTGDLTIGSTGIFYVNGSKRFDPELNRMSNEVNTNFVSARSLVRRQEYIHGDLELASTVEDNGIFYFAYRHFSNKSFCHVLVASDGNQIIGEPLIDYSPIGMTSSPGDVRNPRIIIHEDDLFYIHEKEIKVVNKSLTRDAWNQSRIILGNNITSKRTASHHCISPSGNLYTVFREGNDPVASIHGFSVNDETELISHLYPENRLELPTLRSMAISNKGLLAYSSVDLKSVNFYQLHE